MARPRKKDQGTPLQTSDVTAPQSARGTISAHPDRDRIAMRAYELYLERGGGDGAAVDDWLAAERELNPSRRERRRES